MKNEQLTYVDTLVDQAHQDDELYAGDVLRKTAKAITRKIRTDPDFFKVTDKERLTDAWRVLVQEVFYEYHHEREILSNGLEIREFRPRTFFSELPEKESWDTIETKSGLKADYRTIGPSRQKAQHKEGPSLSILLPIRSGYRKTFRSLACLCYDIRSLIQIGYKVDFHICINFSDDNTLYEVTRFATTFGQSRDLAFTLYSLEDPTIHGQQGSGDRWWKNVVLDIMLRRVIEQSGYCQEDLPDNHYIHFADDDIFISPESNVLEGNIKDIKDNPELLVVSAAYSSNDNRGFSAINSVRKLEDYVRVKHEEHGAEEKLLNLYGGCMTTTLERLKRALGEQMWFSEELTVGEDSYLTVAANFHLIKATPSSDPCKFSFSALSEAVCAYASRRRIVGHSEPFSIAAFVQRFSRDSRWSSESVKLVIDTISRCQGQGQGQGKESEEYMCTAFSSLRLQSFDPIQKAIQDSSNYRHILAQAWYRLIRDEVKTNLNQWRNENGTLKRDLRYVQWATHKTQHQICVDIVSSRHIFQEVSRCISKGAFGFDLVSYMRASDDHLLERFPVMSRLLASVDRETIGPALVQNSYLYHWYSIAEESLAFALGFLQDHIESGATEDAFRTRLSQRKIAALKSRFRFSFQDILKCAFPEDPPQIAPQEESRNDAGGYRVRRLKAAPNSYCAFLYRVGKVKGTKKDLGDLFVRYFSVTGRGLFFKESPRRMVYLHVFGEAVIGAIIRLSKPEMGERSPGLSLVRTLYPSLEQATVNYAGPERHGPFDRLMQSLYIQESLSGRAKPLTRVALSDDASCNLANRLGSFLGRIHGTTFGVRSYLSRVYLEHQETARFVHSDPRNELVALLLEHLDQLRLFDPKVYKKWLTNGADRPGTVANLMEETEGQIGSIAAAVSELLSQDHVTLDQVWDEVCTESEDWHNRFGSVGHQGLFAANLLISSKGDRADVIRPCRGSEIMIIERADILDEVFLGSHRGIAMIDPAVEAGLGIAELITARLNSITLARSDCVNASAVKIDDLSLQRIVDAFRNTYIKTFEQVLISRGGENSPPDPCLGGVLNGERLDETMKSRLAQRASRVAAFSLLVRFNARREYDLLEEERTKLVHTCVDLLHTGAILALRFRYRIPPPRISTDV